MNKSRRAFSAINTLKHVLVMAAAIASSTSSQNASSTCKTNIKTSDLDKKNQIDNNTSLRSTTQIFNMSKTHFGPNDQRSTGPPHIDESHKFKPIFNLNDLVWAKLNNHPWWPCRIIHDNYNIYHRRNGDKQMYFVEFISSCTEKAWVFDVNVFKYDGIDSFKKYAQDQVDRATSKSAKEELAERFQLKIATNRREEWDNAIKLADFMKKNIISTQNHNKIESKRKRETGDFKDDDANLNFNRVYIKNENHVQNSYNYEILPFNNKVSKNEVKKFKTSENIFKNEQLADFNNNRPNRKVEDLSDDDENENLNEDFTTNNQIGSDQNDNFENTTLSSIINEQKDLIEQMKKKRGRKPKSPSHLTNSMVNQFPENELKLKIKLNNIPNIKEENLSDNEYRTKTNSTRSRSNSSSSASSRSSSSSSDSSSSSCSSASSDSTSCSSSDTNGFDNVVVSEIRKNFSPTSSNWSSSTDYEITSSLNQNNFGIIRNNSDSIVERINIKKQNARKSSTSFCLSSPTPSLPTPIKRKQNIKSVGRKRSSKSLSEQTNIDNSLFDENNLLTSAQNFNESIISGNGSNTTPETYLIDRYKYAVRHIKQGLSVEEACNKYRISKGALLKCLSGGTAPRGKKTRLSESEENEIVEWLISYKDLKYNEAIHLVFQQVAQKFEAAQRPNPFNNGKPSMDWWYDFLSRHPQIMASKPDWLKRGKVNDQYIKDVQSGHLKCTKFRRALLSAIQYIKSLNDPVSASILESVTIGESSTQASSSSTPSSTISDIKPKINQKLINQNKPTKVKSTKIKPISRPKNIEDNNKNNNLYFNDSEKRSYQRSLSSTPIQQSNIYPNMILNNSNILNENSNYQTVLHNRNNSNCSSTTVTTNSIDYNDEDLSSVSPISLINSKLTRNDVNTINHPVKSEELLIDSNDINKPHELLTNDFVNSDILTEEDDDEENENIENQEQDDNLEDYINANATYHTEIFDSADFENDYPMIDPNELIGKTHQNNPANHYHNIHHHENFINQTIFPDQKYSNEIFFNNSLKYQDFGQNLEVDSFITTRQPMIMNSQMINIPSINSDVMHERSNYSHQIYVDSLNFHDQSNLLVRDEDEETEENHNLIHDHNGESLICDPIYPSVYPH